MNNRYQIDIPPQLELPTHWLTKDTCAIALVACMLKFINMGIWGHSYFIDYSAEAPQTVDGNYLSAYYTFFWIIFSMLSVIMNYSVINRIMHISYACSFYILFTVFHSVVFAENVILSLQLSLYYIMIYLNVCLYLRWFSTADLIRLLTFVGFIFVSVNSLSYMFPSYAFMQGPHKGLFRGFTAHKNDLGYFSAVFMSAALFVDSTQNKIRVLTLFLSLYFVLASFSGQAIILSLISCSVWFLYIVTSQTRRDRAGILWFAAGLIVLAFVYDFTFSGQIFDALGKDTSFTGRDVLWNFLIRDLFDQNIYGYGGGAFDPTSELRARMYSYGIVWPLSTAHSSYLDAFVRYGYVGGVLFIYMVSVSLCLSIVRIVSDVPYMVFGAVLIIISAVGGITASEKIFLPSFGWLVFVIGALLIRTKKGMSDIHGGAGFG